MAGSSNIQVNVSGIVPAVNGDNWFLIDKSGDFLLDRSITATIWLVGGGMDGGDGVWNGNNVDTNNEPIVDTGTGDSYGGDGGDGGYVVVIENVKIPKNVTLNSVIATANDKSGTTLTVSADVYSCGTEGYTAKIGGKGGCMPMAAVGEQWTDQALAVMALDGENGVETPYGFVGSSGGGGVACNGKSSVTFGGAGGEGAGRGTDHRSAGTDATNYGCGGGGGAICGRVAEGQVGGKGKPGCIIISYVAVEDKTLVVQKHYTKKVTVKKNCNTNYATSQNGTYCCGNNGGCGYGNSSGSSPFSAGVYDAKYIDRVEVKSGDVNMEVLAARIQDIETENLALTRQVQELQSKLNSI